MGHYFLDTQYHGDQYQNIMFMFKASSLHFLSPFQRQIIRIDTSNVEIRHKFANA